MNIKVLAMLGLCVLAAVLINQAESSNNSAVTDQEVTPCSYSNSSDSVICNAGFKFYGTFLGINLTLETEPKKREVNISASISDYHLFNHSIADGELCASLPGILKSLDLCVFMYDVSIKVPKKEVETNIGYHVCLIVQFASFFFFQFDCIKLGTDENRTFMHTSAIRAPVTELDLAEGNSKFTAKKIISEKDIVAIKNGTVLFSKEQEAKEKSKITITFNGTEIESSKKKHEEKKVRKEHEKQKVSTLLGIVAHVIIHKEYPKLVVNTVTEIFVKVVETISKAVTFVNNVMNSIFSFFG